MWPPAWRPQVQIVMPRLLFNEAVLRGALDPVARHRLVDVGREGRVLDVVARRDQVLDLVVEEGVVAHAVDVVAERQHAVIGAERAQPGLPQRCQADLAHQSAQKEQQRVAPVRGVGPVAHRLDVEMGLHHAADQLEHLVGDVDRLVGEYDGRPQLAHRRRRGAAEIA
jgi:hypothetical protein